MHEAFESDLEAWAERQTDPDVIRRVVAGGSTRGHSELLLELVENVHTPLDVLEDLAKDPHAAYGLLFNESVSLQMVRDVYELIKDEPFGPPQSPGRAWKCLRTSLSSCPPATTRTVKFPTGSCNGKG